MAHVLREFCTMIHEGKLTHSKAENMLDGLCICYGVEAVAMWMVENDQEAVNWLEEAV